MKEQTLQMHREAHMLAKQLMLVVHKYRKQNESELNLYELVDSSYAIRDILQVVEDVKKDLEKERRMVEAKTGMACMTLKESELKLSTWHCSAKVISELIPNLPRRSSDPEMYDKFIGFFGVKKKFLKYDLLRIHFPNLMNWYNHCWLARGKPEIPGIQTKDHNTIYKLQIRKKKDIESQV